MTIMNKILLLILMLFLFTSCTHYTDTIYRNGTVYYEGEIKKGDLWDSFDGFGKEYYENGNLKYEGEFKEDLYHGKGMFYSENGTLFYDGQFINNAWDGQGKIYSRTGNLMYSGFFSEGEFIEGIFYYAEGTYIVGEFKDYKANGLGKVYDVHDNLLYEGYLLNGSLHGQGKQYTPLGINEGEFIKGDFCNGWTRFYFDNGIVVSSEIEIANCKIINESTNFYREDGSLIN